MTLASPPTPSPCWERGLCFCLLLLSISSLRAQTATNDSTAWYRYVTLNGLVSASTTYNFNHPSDNKNQLRVFDVDANSLLLDLVALTLKHDAARGEAGFRFDLDAGPYIPKIIQSAGLAISDHLDISQGYLTYIVPLGRGITFDVGKFISPVGYEYLERFDGLSDNASHSFLFGYSMPYTHTGLRISFPYPLIDSVNFSFMLVNGWDNTVDNNKSKTLIGEISYSPSQAINLTLTVIAGPEEPHNDTTGRGLGDLVFTFKPSKNVAIGVNLDGGTEQHSVPNMMHIGDTTVDLGPISKPYEWGGFALYLRYGFSDLFAIAGRYEEFSDLSGFRTGAAQTLHSVTLTPEYYPVPNFIIRGDLRYDFSNVPIFDKNGSFVTSQPTASLNVLYTF